MERWRDGMSGTEQKGRSGFWRGDGMDGAAPLHGGQQGGGARGHESRFGCVGFAATPGRCRPPGLRRGAQG